MNMKVDETHLLNSLGQGFSPIPRGHRRAKWRAGLSNLNANED
jgi:hypothetical protein